MPHSKKPKLTHDTATAAFISSDELANIFGYLGPLEILPLRRVCKKWNEAVKKTIVPLVAFEVYDGKSYYTMETMSSALPNLQQLELGKIWNFFAIGSEEFLRDDDSVDIDVISNFTKLQVLKLLSTSLNGSHPCLFNNFPLLEHLTINSCTNLRWDLGMLAGFPLLKELNCREGQRLTGNINSLRLLKDTIEQIHLADCPQVGGNFMDLDFPHLKILDLYTMDSITGDIRDMGEASFPKLEKLRLPKSVYGGNRSEIMRISDAKDLIATIYSIKKQRHRHPSLFEDFNWYLSKSSPDSYQDDPQNQFLFCIFRAGSRLGWRWEQQLCDRYLHFRFEVNWLDPLPANGSNEYQSYIEELQEIESYMDTFPFFRGYHEPPSEAVYYQLTREYRPSPSQEASQEEAERREDFRVYENKILDAVRRKRESRTTREYMILQDPGSVGRLRRT